MRTLVIGDIHGAHRALQQCLERAQVDVQNDHLIVLGDVCDGWPEVRACIDTLLSFRHLDYIIGNHDLWALDWTAKQWQDKVWLGQGGRNTIRSYDGSAMPPAHVQFLQNAPRYLVRGKNLFLHAGFKPGLPIEKQDPQVLAWDRSLLYDASSRHNDDPGYRYPYYEEIYVGHTPTLVFHVHVPVRFCNVWDLDTGAGWSGKLTIMDIMTKEFWQSDFVTSLYPDEQPRG